MLVDSHCHLNSPSMEDDVMNIVARAKQSGVSLMLTICTKMDEFSEVNTIASSFDDVYCSVGVHPHEAKDHRELEIRDLIGCVNHPKVIGVGETGLDFHYDNSPRQEQIDLFRIHCSAALKTGLPLIVHSRGAEEETAAILSEASAEGELCGVIHCFTGGTQLAREVLDLGFYISLSGIVTFPSASELRNVAQSIPLNRLLVETDAPYLAPVPMRGRSNEPAFVTYTAKSISELLGISFQDIEKNTTQNFFRLFSKALPPKEIKEE